MRPAPVSLTRWVALATATAAAATALVACGGGPAAPGAVCPQQVPAGSQPVAVTMWAEPIDQPALAKLADRFNAADPAIHVTVVGHPVRDWLVAVRDRQPQPDLVALGGNFTQVAIDSRAVVPVEECIDAAHYPLGDFLPNTLAATRTEGRQWGLPLGYPPMVLLYDRAAFARAGLDPSKPPTTLNELGRYAQALQRAGITRPISNIWLAKELELSGVPLFDAANGHTGRASRPVIDSPQGRGVVDAVNALFAALGPPPSSPVPPPPPRPAELPWDLQLLGSGQVGIIMHTGWDLGKVAKLNASGAQIAVAALPTLSGAVAWPRQTSLFLSSASTPARRAATWAFLRWFEDPAQQATEFFPTRRQATTADPAQREVWKLMTTTPEPASVPIDGINAPITNLLGRMVGDIGSGTPAPQALRRAQTDAGRLLSDYNADPVGFALLHLADG
ncbi:MAG: ABC transporter substrate-binding protein [Acidimicrobiales bacterium]